MSLQFLRDLNKNVAESLSILNEGLEITNGVTEVGNIHLPYIRQLCVEDGGPLEAPRCCIFRQVPLRGASHTREGLVSVPSVPLSEASDRSGVESGSRRTASVSSVDAASLRGEDEGNNGLSPEIDMSPCALGEACLLNRVDATRYEKSLEAVIEFLRVVDAAFASRAVATRNLLETQVLPVLCSLMILSEVAQLFERPSAQLLGKFANSEALHMQVLSILSSALKLMDLILVYPEGLTSLKDRKIFESELSPDLQYRNGDLEARTVSGLLKDSALWDDGGQDVRGSGCPSGFEYFGRVGVIEVSEQERDGLKQYLSLLHSVGIATQFGRSLMAAAGLCVDGHGLLERDVVASAISVFEKLYTHNDLAWHLHQDNDQLLYTVDKLDACYVSWHLGCKGVCLACGRPFGIRDIPESLEGGDMCDCMVRPSDIVSPQRHLIEEELMLSSLNPRRLVRLTVESGDMVLKTRVSGLLLQMVLNSDAFVRHFVAEGCVDLLLDVLESCYLDQFGVLNESLAEVPLEMTKKRATALEKDLTIGMSYVPCSLDCILMLRHCLKLGDYGRTVSRRTVEFVGRLASTVLKTWVFYYCSERGYARDRENSVFRQSVCIVMDMCCALIVPGGGDVQVAYSRDQLQGKEHLAVRAVKHLIACQHSVNVSIFQAVLETGIVEQVMLAAHLLCNRTRFGYNAPERVLDDMMVFVSTVATASHSSPEASALLLTRLQAPIGELMPPVYAHVYHDMQTRDMEALKTTPIESQGQARLRQFRLEMFGDLVNISVIEHWMLCLQDSDVVASMRGPFRHWVIMLVVASGFLEGNDRVVDMLDYARESYRETVGILEVATPDGTPKVDWRHLTNMLDLSMALMASDVDVSQHVELLGMEPWALGVDVLKASVKGLKLSNTGDVVPVMLSSLSHLVSCLCIYRVNAGLNDLDTAPMIDLLKVDVDGPRYAMVRRIAAFVLSVMSACGVPLVEQRFGVDALVVVSECLNALYSSVEHVRALRMLDEMQPPHHVDGLVLPYDRVLETFLSSSQQIQLSEALGVALWHRTRLHEFDISPRLHKLIAQFRRLLHPHVMTRLIDELQEYELVRSGQTKQMSSKTDEEIEHMRQLHTEEIRFAQDRIAKLAAQVDVMSQSYYVAEANVRNSKEEILVLLEENRRLREWLEHCGDAVAIERTTLRADHEK
ncbi:ATP-dependent protease La, putative [Babesia caballi]|uniref:ATP-dependent protease La, putative n=1 Tax=Babesia caballi TaxID=5871 RepID=A0AAV4LVS3_BABCB|nr:ATP-dependent protease La, putative [Babesia caballi]